MQTFLPYANFEKSAKVLDYRRLGKQRVECKQILNAIDNFHKSWHNHPITQMWIGYEEALRQYQRIIILEWIDRGYNNNMEIPEEKAYANPIWLGDERIHSSHRSMLLQKDQTYYGQFGWSDSLPHYYWYANTFQQANKYSIAIGDLYVIQ